MSTLLLELRRHERRAVPSDDGEACRAEALHFELAVVHKELDRASDELVAAQAANIAVKVAQKQKRLTSRAADTFSWLAILAPRRVWQEETGDALEIIAAMEVAGCSAFKIKLKVWSTILWVLLNGLREFVAGLTGRKSPLK